MNIRIALAALLVFAPALACAQSVFDGSWMVQKEDKTLDLNSVVTFKVGREVAELSTLSGITYKAKLNGADAKVEGDPKTTTVSVTRPSKNVLLEISKRDGKPWLSMRMAVEPDGKTAKVTWKNLNTDKGGSYEMAKQ
ncbi:hypothetical protein [Ramlibacter sp. WS9]|uniref:hypothetical protein n=1 Tax=Ramlibacter sp. WS9 TaxID=1882741 RepID=UPI001142F6EE|nr:hypothetical protein [Ramlibacter sp. WS9]ROZ78925.1 hypothetical protein EEB15_04350 [Ramlibacter sp. WS9]